MFLEWKSKSCLTLKADTPEEALFLQFSGGTTGDQKCVVVTAPMLVNQLNRLSKTLQFNRGYALLSWLPMYHDMGLIACFWLPLWNEACSTQFAVSDWLMGPGLLFHLMSTYRATFCWLPNFAFAYLAAQKERLDRKDESGSCQGMGQLQRTREGTLLQCFYRSLLWTGSATRTVSGFVCDG